MSKEIVVTIGAGGIRLAIARRPDSGFITGSDLLIDGGVIAAIRAGRIRVGI